MRDAEPFALCVHALKGVSVEPLSGSSAIVMADAMAQTPPWSVYGSTAERLEAGLKTPSPGVRSFEILVDGALAGVVSIHYPWLFGPYLQRLAILPHYRGKKIGFEVLRWMEGEACKARANQLWLCVSTFNSRAQTFYRRFGFEPVAVLERLASDSVDECLMRKRLRYGQVVGQMFG